MRYYLLLTPRSFFFYVGVVATFLRLILLLITLAQAQDDVFPQGFRNNSAYWIIGLNVAIFLCLIVRQLFVLGKLVLKWCRERSKPQVDFSNEAVDDDDDDEEGAYHYNKRETPGQQWDTSARRVPIAPPVKQRSSQKVYEL